ncbi:MAG: alanine racemase [Eubacteriales bacterium]|jgi:alanine racemase|nr:alanine racemase [Bacillota bacterium]MBV1735814.1 alanine racemase [Desulforudis sp.]MDP3051569.1 alanine racemase [Eubacteriales bacterium]MBU4554453.1 alanine racemase [Bacillota bacterium]MBV1770064.1 alanine racemase [Desulforudis sp.]
MGEHSVWAEVDASALIHNLHEVSRLVGRGTEIMAVVKANAYGHGLVDAARIFLNNGADRLGVARPEEGVELRRAGIEAPIILLGYTPPAAYRQVLENELTVTLYNYELARLFSVEAGKAGISARVHLKIDTGMHRLGLQVNDEIYKEILQIALLPHLVIEGLFTHFAKADEKDKRHANQQLLQFFELTCTLGQDGLDIPVLHAANSAAVIDIPESHMNLVRPGLMLYGLYPSDQVDHKNVQLRPALSLKAQVSMVKKVPAGTGISYGCTYTTEDTRVLATVPAGYGDGYTRLLSNKGEVLVHGVRAPVVGTVCMDQIIVDVTRIDGVAIGDEVVLYGVQDGVHLPVEDAAGKIGTINYEITCALSVRVPRIYIQQQGN